MAPSMLISSARLHFSPCFTAPEQTTAIIYVSRKMLKFLRHVFYLNCCFVLKADTIILVSNMQGENSFRIAFWKRNQEAQLEVVLFKKMQIS